MKCTAIPDTGQKQSDLQTALLAQQANSDWLCLWCHNHIANDGDRFVLRGKSEFVFANPDGIQFEVLSFIDTLRCAETGVPTLEHTWFPGYAWSYCQCGECGRHLGWYYTGPQHFACLIRERIVRAVDLNN